MKTTNDADLKVTISIPKNKVEPVGRRIFAISVDPANIKTSSGIIIPTFIDKGETSSGERKYVKLRRFFVVDFDPEIKMKGLCKGIEVIPFLTEDMIGYTFAYVIDWENGGEKYIVFHESEVAGVSKNKPVFTDYKPLILLLWIKKISLKLLHVFATLRTKSTAKS